MAQSIRVALTHPLTRMVLTSFGSSQYRLRKQVGQESTLNH